MDRTVGGGRVLAGAALLGLVLAIVPTSVRAAPTYLGRPLGGVEPNSVPAIAGTDVSYPECGGALPLGQAFAVVGVNGGRANTFNPCLAAELLWAAYRSSGASAEPRVSVYLNTGDPGNSYLGQEVADWPNSGITPYGACLPTVIYARLFGAGQMSPACAFEYGYQKAEADVHWLRIAAARDRLPIQPGAYPFWLDVETTNSWQNSTLLNTFDLEGMVYALQLAGVKHLGVYAFTPQWDQITGGSVSLASGSLVASADWIPVGGSLGTAESGCQQPPFTGTFLAMTQFFSGPYDADFAC
ncbi:MAG: hypothetical protein WA695_02915 [Candidatus Dormiibacterota bacterium]